MYTAVIGEVTIQTVRNRKLMREDGSSPVRIRVSYGGQKVHYTTNQNLTDKEWANLSSTKNPQIIFYRTIIKSTFDRVERITKELVDAGQFSFEVLSIRLRRRSAGTLEEWFSRKLRTLIESGQAGTYEHYRQSLRHIQQEMGTGIEVEEVDVEWLRCYEAKLVARGLNVTTIAMQMTTLRHILHRLKVDKFISSEQYPFGRYKYLIRKGEARKRALDLDAISRIAAFDACDDETLRLKDFWLFLYYANGMNLADMVQLRYGNIVDGEIRFVREKTKRRTLSRVEICVAITPEIQAIIQRWGNPPAPENYLFDTYPHTEDAFLEKKREEQFLHKMNRSNNYIGERLGIGRLTTYMARHSYATILKQSGTPIAYISESMGHTSLSTTQNYLGNYSAEMRMKAANLLLKS